MLKILSGSQVKIVDNYHCRLVGISSHDLMERAAKEFVNWFVLNKKSIHHPIAIFCGSGNNGGDGLAIGRLLYNEGYPVQIFCCFSCNTSLSPDCKKNLELLPAEIPMTSWQKFKAENFPCIIDAYLGVGLTGELRAEAKSIISTINSAKGKKIAIDVPSGLPSEGECTWECVHADDTITFAFPKLNLLFPEFASYTGELTVLDIGISDKEYVGFSSGFYYFQGKDIPSFHKKFHRFSHKGDFGKVLIVAGSKGKMGAAILAAKSALRTGSGLVTCLIPEDERTVLPVAVPEAMSIFETSEVDFSSFDAVGIGPGLGLDKVGLFEKVLICAKRPMVLDADALTLLSLNHELKSKIPSGSILTPHLGEFERLFGISKNHGERLAKAREFCSEYSINLVIKGANSVLCLSDGRQLFNSSGSPYMATAGMGDVLTGMLTSFLGQGYSPEQAMVCGVFQHGLAGELAGIEKLRSTMASDLIEKIPETFKKLGVF